MPFHLKALDQATALIKASWNMEIDVDKDEDSDFKLQPDIPKYTRQNPIMGSGTKAPLSERLANFPTNISNQTFLATTQLRDGNIDMDHREIPRTNSKKRGVLFAQRRLEGRTGSYTLFLSLNSICGYRRVQLFVHLLTQFLWITNLWREMDNHRSYQDYIREAWTQNILLTDNARSQVGKKWTETPWKNKTQQIMLAPDKQNHNSSERKANDAKQRVDYTLFTSQVPILFWCYCM